MSEPVIVALLTLAVVLAVLSIVAADLLVAALALGAFGFVLALIWAALGAVDVSFTEAVVGAGATTIFFLAALLRTGRHRSSVPAFPRWAVFVVTAAVTVTFLGAARELPLWGDPAAPPGTHVSPRYLEQALAETETPNVVTAVLADYRSYDTLIEAVVIFTGGLGGWLLLARRR